MVKYQTNHLTGVNSFYNVLCEVKTSAGIQAAADRGDTKSVYDGI